MNIKTTILSVSLLICSALSAIAHGPTFPPDPEDGARITNWQLHDG